MVLSTMVDGVILLVGTQMVHREQLQASLEALTSVDNTVLGLVLNRVSTSGVGRYGYYHSYTEPTARFTRRPATRNIKARKRRAT